MWLRRGEIGEGWGCSSFVFVSFFCLLVSWLVDIYPCGVHKYIHTRGKERVGIEIEVCDD